MRVHKRTEVVAVVFGIGIAIGLTLGLMIGVIVGMRTSARDDWPRSWDGTNLEALRGRETPKEGFRLLGPDKDA